LSGGYIWPSRTTLQVALGALIDGALVDGTNRYEESPGLLAAVTVAHPWRRGAWFATATLSLATARTHTGDDTLRGDMRVSLTAGDLRGGVMAGRRFGPFSPYVLARAFGGPVFWTIGDDDVTGTDVHHYQLGAGASLATARGLAVTVDASLLGERSASLGVSVPL
jgi:hypothetical protein